MSTRDKESVSGDHHDGPTLALEEIPADQCFELLATKSVGRLVIVVADEPDVFTVNYVVDGTDIVFRTAWGLKLMQSALQRIAFQVDDIDDVRHEGWSVVLRGVGEEMTDEVAHEPPEARDDILLPWAPGAKDHWVRMIPRIVTGRRLVGR